MTETNSPMGDTNDAPVAQEPPLLESVATEAPSRLQSMALGDTTQEREQRDITNWPALIGLAAFFVFIGYLGIAYLAMVLGLVIMIFLHELGHFMTAKWSGMKATQFFLGFGPTLFSRQRGEVEWGIKALPFGAFVRIVGMSNLDPYDPADADKAYINKSYPRRMWVITAGSVMHFIQAAIILVFAVSIVGVRDAAVIDGALEDAPRPWTIGEISQLETGETPSIEAGLEVGDRIVSMVRRSRSSRSASSRQRLGPTLARSSSKDLKTSASPATKLLSVRSLWWVLSEFPVRSPRSTGRWPCCSWLRSTSSSAS